jgi:hypothetical protein
MALHVGQLSDVARVEREHRLNGFKELGKELHDVLHMQVREDRDPWLRVPIWVTQFRYMPLLQTTLEGKVQRCQFEIAKSTNNSNVRPPCRMIQI